MEFVQSLAGRASSAVERLGGSRESRQWRQNEPARTRDFASALAVAINSPTRATSAAVAAPTHEERDHAPDEAAEPSEAAEAAAGMAMGAPIDPTRVHRSLELLDPEFRVRLQRVIERMQSEFGHSVQVTETFRSQERQQFLFEQGRSRPGQVVTWTRASNHSLGRAADVMIDGTYNNPRGYARLAEIAAQEGLNTLGPKDPGHVELRGGSRTPPEMLAALAQRSAGEQASWEPTLQLATRVPAGGIARVAEVARVADVARVAEVARLADVARVAVPGMAYAAAAAHAQPLQEAMGSMPSLSSLRSELGSGSSGADEEGTDAQGQGAPGWGETDIARGDLSLFTRGTFQSTVSQVLETGGAAAAERVARVMELQDGARGPVNHVVLRVDNPAGGQDRIRVDLRGTAVDATLDMSNAADAQRISTRITDLQKALENRGLEAEALRVRSTAAEGQNAARMALGAAESDPSRGSRADGGAGNPDREDPDRQDGQPRREPADGREHGRQHQPRKENS
jgi:uncharacterized protein YcbK (DUF882 family)